MSTMSCRTSRRGRRRRSLRPPTAKPRRDRRGGGECPRARARTRRLGYCTRRETRRAAPTAWTTIWAGWRRMVLSLSRRSSCLSPRTTGWARAAAETPTAWSPMASCGSRRSVSRPRTLRVPPSSPSGVRWPRQVRRSTPTRWTLRSTARRATAFRSTAASDPCALASGTRRRCFRSSTGASFRSALSRRPARAHRRRPQRSSMASPRRRSSRRTATA
mmetsp:Transcript_9765/g.40244  ORF Transcript_9765/g.40244 Transcript_9765/m.40244 type:complete len:218 (-) Transcript_9765:205-858(-)